MNTTELPSAVFPATTFQKKTFELLLLGAAALIPFDVLFPFLPIRLTAAEVLLSVAFTAWFVERWRDLLQAPRGGLLTPLIGFLFAAAMSSLMAVSRGAVARETIQFAWLVLMILFLANTLRDEKLIARLQIILLTVSVVASIVGIYQYFFLREPVSGLIAPTRFRAVGFYDQPNTFGSYLIGVLPLAVTSLLVAPLTSIPGRWGRTGKMLNAIAVFFLSMALVATFSRGSWVGFAAAGVVLLLLVWRMVPWQRLVWGTALGIGAALIIFFDLARQPATVDPEFSGRSFSNQERILLASAAIEMAKDHPLFGIGFGNFPHRLPEYATPELKTLLQRDYDTVQKRFFINPEKPPTIDLVHNMLLQVLCETGIVGCAFFLWLIVRLLAQSIRNVVRQKDPTMLAHRAASFVGLLAILVAGLFGWPFSHGVLELIIILAGISLSQSS